MLDSWDLLGEVIKNKFLEFKNLKIWKFCSPNMFQSFKNQFKKKLEFQKYILKNLKELYFK